jgi:hypothetical protein
VIIMLSNKYMKMRLRKLQVVMPEVLFGQMSRCGLLRHVDGISTNLFSENIEKMDNDQRALRS